jgi:hypothetical protein
MKLQDMIHLKGEVLIQAVDFNGNVSTLVEDKNLIVSAGRLNICSGLIGIQSAYISDVHFGNGGTIPGNSTVATSVSPDELDVASVIAAVNGADYTFTSVMETSPSPRAVFSIIIPTVVPPTYSDQSHITSLNGQAISELALMLNTNPQPTAFAIKRFPSISKSDTISLIINWIIYV